MNIQICIWLVVSTPLKNMKVSWDDDSQYMENKIHVPNRQPDMYMCSMNTYQGILANCRDIP